MMADTNDFSYVDILITILAAIFLIWSLCGYSIYLLYMRRDEANKDRLLNNLYANMAISFMIHGVLRFMRILQYFAYNDTDVSCLLVRCRHFLDLFTIILFLQISVVTSINHYNPSLYLELSLKGRRLTVLCVQALVVALLLAAVELNSGSGEFCASEEVEQKLYQFLFPLLALNLVLQLGVGVDSYWGWARIWRRMVTLVMRMNDSVQPVNNLELGNVQAEDQSEETPVTEKVQKYCDIHHQK